MNHLLRGRHRLDMIPGNPKTMAADDHPQFYWKCLGETDIPFMVHGMMVIPRFYIWKPLNGEGGNDEG